MKRRHFMAGATATLAAHRVGRAQNRSVLKFIPQADLAVLDPIQVTAQVTRNHAMLVFDTLYGVDEKWQTQPQMVEGHTVENDGRLWRLTLRDGLKFHDGTPVLARDVAASLQRWGKRDTFGSAVMAATDEVAAPSDKVVELRLKKPFALLPDALAKIGPNIAIVMPERLAQTDPFKQVTEMVGSGPYRFVANERVAGSLAVYERFAGYVPRPSGTPSLMAGPKVAKFDRVEWHTIPDPATAAAAVQAGEMDWWEQPSPDYWAVLKKNARLVVEVLDPGGIVCMARFNFMNAPYDKAAVRRAALAATNQAEVMTAVAGADPSMWRDGVGFFLPGTPMASEAGLEAVMGHDPAKAKQLLKESGYAGEKLVFLIPTDYASLNAQGLVIVDQWSKAGFNVEPQMMDFGTMVQRLQNKQPIDKGGWNAFSNATTGVNTVNPIVNSLLRGDGGSAPLGWPDVPQMQRLRAAWLDAPDLASQQKICEQIQALALQEVFYVPSGIYYQPTVYQNTLTGVLKGFPVFYNVRRI